MRKRETGETKWRDETLDETNRQWRRWQYRTARETRERHANKDKGYTTRHPYSTIRLGQITHTRVVVTYTGIYRLSPQPSCEHPVAHSTLSKCPCCFNTLLLGTLPGVEHLDRVDVSTSDPNSQLSETRS